MDRKQHADLVERLRDELRERELDGLTQLFGSRAVGELSGLFFRIYNVPNQLSDAVIGKIVSQKLMIIFSEAGCIDREPPKNGSTSPDSTVMDNPESLERICAILREMNQQANQMAYGNHDITCRTNDLLTWLGNDARLLRDWQQNRPPKQ